MAGNKEDVDYLKEVLQTQLSEVEMLQSMFPDSGEFELDDPLVISEINDFLKDEIGYKDLHLRLGFTIKLHFDSEINDKNEVELVCSLPHDYPHVIPDILTRTKHLGRLQQKAFSEDLLIFLHSTERGEMCVYQIVQWIQDNLDMYTHQDTKDDDRISKPAIDKQAAVFSRIWIYSHHIYSKTKRIDINEFAQEFKLTGFLMPGKPGVICAEGDGGDIETFWYRIRRMNWKRIMIKEKEDIDIQTSSLDTFRKFKQFQEIAFDVRAGKGREYHMDLGLFYKFLQEHESAHIFEMYFGVEGKN